MTYEPEIQRSYSNWGDVLAAWGVYFVFVAGWTGYGLVQVFV
jgi:hypothetical protein